MKVDKTKWTTRCLGEVCTFSRGLTYPKSEETTEITDNVVLRSNNIDLSTHSLVLSDFKYLNSKYKVSSTKLVQRDSILMCMSNGSAAHIGKVAFIDKDYPYAFGGFMGLYKPINVFPKFLYYIFRSNTFKVALAKIGNGINITNLKFSSISPLLFNIPPLSEQRGIAAELDAIQAMIDGYQEQLADLDRLAQSIFLETFGDPISNPKGWEISSFGDLFSLKSGDGLSAKNFNGGDFPVYGGNGIAGFHDSFNKDGIYIVIGRVGALCGNIHLVKGKFWLTDNAFELIQKKSLFNNLFLARLLAILNLGSKAKKMAQPVISNVSLKDISVVIPPFPLQQQFAAQVEAIERQKEAIRQQLADAETLMAERMQYYFS